MKALKKILLLLILSLSPMQLWAIEDEEPKNLQETILSLYKSASKIQKKILKQGFQQTSSHSTSFNEEFIDSFFQGLSDTVINEALESLSQISKELIDIIETVEISEFKTFFENELAITDINSFDSHKSHFLGSWFQRTGPMFLSALKGNPSIRAKLQFKLLFMDCFNPSFWSLNENGKELHYLKVLDANGEEKSQLLHPYFWLLDEMIQFLLKAESMKTEESLRILGCVNVLLQKSEFVPFANKELVQAFYCNVWIKQTSSKFENLGRLKDIFNQSKNSWRKIFFSKALQEMRQMRSVTSQTN